MSKCGAWILLGGVSVAAAWGGEPWTLVSVDGARQRMSLDGLSFPGQGPVPEGGRPGPMNWSDVDTIELGASAAETTSQGTWEVRTRGGGVLACEVTGGGVKSLEIRSFGLGELTIPIGVIAEIRRRGDTSLIEAADSDEDVVGLVGGDVLRGAVSQFSRQSISVFDGDNDRDVSWDSVQRVSLAATGAKSAGGLRALVRLVDGAVFAMREFRVKESRIVFDDAEARTVDGKGLSVPIERVRCIEVLGGRRSWLSALAPAKYELIPYMDMRWPYRMDRCVTGGPLGLGGRAYDRGIGLHSACRIAWKLDGQYERFRGLVGIDDSAGPLADADVRVFVDGRAAAGWEHIRHAAAPVEVDVSVTGAKELVIEVGFGAGGDTQDRVNLVNAALIAKPASPRGEPN